MKLVGFISTAVLSLTLGVTAPAYAQREQQDEKQDHPKQEQQKHEQDKPEKQQTQRAVQQKQSNEKQEHVQQQQRQNQNKQQAQRAEQQQRSNQKQEHAQQQQRKNQSEQQHAQKQPQRTQQHVEQSAWQQHRSQHWDSDHRTWRQRGGYNGYRIPEDRFRGYFGPDHGFRIYGLPFLVVGGYPRFQYSGYWFSPVDPWPEYWASDWYDTDDVYVVYMDNGYYMFNPRYPNTGIAIRISL